MNEKIRKANENMEFFNGLIDEIRINGHERLRAKARLAQGEAMATAVVELFAGRDPGMLRLRPGQEVKNFVVGFREKPIENWIAHD